MAVASLSKFTVPLPNQVNSGTQGMLMPKLKYRFRVIFQNFGVGGNSSDRLELTKQIVDVTRPQVVFDDILIDTYNSRIKLAGKPTWQDITLTLRDDVAGNISRLVGQQLQKQFDFFEQSSAASGIDYKFTTQIEMLDGGNGNDVPSVLELWELYGCYIQSANYGDLNYSTNDPATVQLTLKYDNAIQLPQPTAGVGSDVVRTRNTVATGGGSRPLEGGIIV